MKIVSSVLGDSPGGVRFPPPVPLKRGLRYCREREAVAVTEGYLRALPLNDRDRDIVHYLGEIGYATTEQLARMYWSHRNQPLKRAQSRLAQLWRWHILDRAPGQGLSRYGIAPQLVYMLGDGGMLLLKETESLAMAGKHRKRSTALLHHNVMLGEALTGLVELSRQSDCELTFFGERAVYISFEWGERLVKIQPDGMLVISFARVQAENLTQVEYPLFIEMDAGTRDLGAIGRKVLQYEFFYDSGTWKARYSRFPGIGIIVWGAGDDTTRSEKAEARLRAAIESVKSRRQRREISWIFARLDQAQSDTWHLLDRADNVRAVHLLALSGQTHQQGRQGDPKLGQDRNYADGQD